DVPHENGARVQMLCRPEQVVLAAEKSDLDGPVIGRGTVLEESFVGPVRRLRLRVPRIPRLRQVAPPPVFGEEGLIVDAAVASDQPIPSGEVWVGLRGW